VNIAEYVILYKHFKNIVVIPKSIRQLIKSLDQKKHRKSSGLFLVEGNKMALDLLSSDIEIETMIVTDNFLKTNSTQIVGKTELISTDWDQIRKASLLKTPQDALAICKIPEYGINHANPANNWVLCLDGIQDPGNLGTIIRIADWFGITDIVCSPDTVDAFNPKTVQATMGSIFRTRVHYTQLPEYFAQMQESSIFIGGTFLEGENIYTKSLPSTGIMIMGNEGSGIREVTFPYISEKIFIPSFAKEKTHAESLNVGVATAIICSEIRSRNFG
jgi:TrmH family RNA methyltransferase